ncbi:hypothetical protein EYF80_026232 [Liparis tanakae]|uniref:Uncharacterized protein n=1 Tax=Liparis tanakae TaxID=230148 RepID=A0A4Z2HDH6_9TELE|nr:hypothetical protein EYF80_026232 [Liparis tanakae]
MVKATRDDTWCQELKAERSADVDTTFSHNLLMKEQRKGVRDRVRVVMVLVVLLVGAGSGANERRNSLINCGC